MSVSFKYRPSWRVTAIFVAILVAGCDIMFCLLCDRASGGVYPPLDDAYIHAQVARNFARGRSWGFNAYTPTAASTSPLFTGLLALVGRLFSSEVGWIWVARALGIVFHAATATLLFSFIARHCASLTVAVTATVATMLQGSLLWGATSGMEIMLAAFLCLLILTIQVARSDTLAAASLQGVLCGLLILTRPDAISLLALIIIDRMLQCRQIKSAELNSTVTRLRVRYSPSVTVTPVICASLLGAYAMFTLWVDVRPMPNSFGAKAGFQGYAVLMDYWRDALFAFFTFHPFLWALLLAATVIGIRRWLRGNGSIALLAWPWIFLLSQSIGNPRLYNHGRYITFMIPAIAALIVKTLLPRDRQPPFLCFEFALGHRIWTMHLRKSLALYFLLFFALVFSLYSARTWSRKYTKDQTWIKRNYEAITNHLRQEFPEVRRLATHDIGYFGFVGGFQVYDLAGLATPSVLQYRRLPREQELDRIIADLKQDDVRVVTIFANGYRDLSIEDLTRSDSTVIHIGDFSLGVPKQSPQGAGASVTSQNATANEEGE